MVRVGVIGTGGIGNRHAQCYRDNALAELVAVCDVQKEKADAAAARHGAKPYYGVPEMLADAGLDAVSVTTAGVENGSDHYEPTMQALAAGLHVLCEKPLCNELDKAREMAAEAQRRNLCLGVNLNHRFTPAAKIARGWLDEGKLGQPLLINMVLWIRNPNETSPWFHLRALHAHSVDVMRYFCGDVARVQCFLSKGPGRTIWSNASINMHFARGVMGHLAGSYDMTGAHTIERCEVAGNEGRFVIENVCELVTYYPHRSREETAIRHAGGMTAFEQTFPARIHRWLEQLTERTPPERIEGSGAECVAAQQVIEAAIRSWETGAVVDVASL